MRLVAILLLAVAVLPYGVSRVASSWRGLSVHSIAGLLDNSSDDTGLKIACYNIAHGRGLATSNWQGGTDKQRKTRLDEIADLLRDIDADVVVLNEVDFDSSWSASTNQAAYLAQRAGYAYRAEQRNLDFRVLTWKWRFGNAVLSRYPIVQASVVDLPSFSAVETLLAGKKRGVVCTIDVNGRNVRVVGAHLSHRSEAIRARSAKEIIRIAGSDDVPTMVAGDLNSSPSGFPHSRKDADEGNALDVLDASSLFQRRPEHGPVADADLTFHSAQPRSIIDWILVPRDCQVIDYRVIPSTLSDHRPVVAHLSFESAEDESAAK